MSANKNDDRRRAARRFQRQFGVTYTEALEAIADQPIRLRYASDGLPFTEWLRSRTDDPEKAQRVWAFVQEWDHLRDELGEARRSSDDPALEEFAARWNRSVEETLQTLREFQCLVPGERQPTRVVRLLWEGLHQVADKPFTFGSIGAVRVREISDEERLRWERDVLSGAAEPELFGMGRTPDYEFQAGRPGMSPTIDLVRDLEKRGLVVIAEACDVDERRHRTHAAVTDAGRERLELLGRMRL